MPLLTGNTWPLREHLKCLGGSWNPDAKGWQMPDEMFDEACTIVAHFQHTLNKLPVSACRNRFHAHPTQETDHA
jgi:hypothetical protein